MTFQKEYKSFLREIDFTKKKVQFVLLLTVNLWVPFRINNKLMEVMFFFLENLNCENFTPCVSFCEKIRESAATFVVAEMMMREVLVIHCKNFFLSLWK